MIINMKANLNQANRMRIRTMLSTRDPIKNFLTCSNLTSDAFSSFCNFYSLSFSSSIYF